MAGEGKQFERRQSDVNVTGLALRVGALEGRMEVMEQKVDTQNRELAANTRLTMQTHSKVEGIEKDTTNIVAAVQWLSTTKKVVIVIIAGVSGTAGAIVAAAHAIKVLGVLG